jgi:hypothetical protein
MAWVPGIQTPSAKYMVIYTMTVVLRERDGDGLAALHVCRNYASLSYSSALLTCIVYLGDLAIPFLITKFNVHQLLLTH